MRKTIILIFVMLAALFSATAQQNEPTYFSDSEIVFSSGSYGQYEIFMLSNDLEPIQLTDFADELGGVFSARWSPNGEEIAFTNQEDVYIVNADGTNLTQLTQDVAVDDYYIDWSPDGTMIAVASSQENDSRIRLIDVAHLEVVDLLQDNNDDGQFGITWSPDGKYLVFTSDRNSDSDAIGLYAIEISSRDIITLTNPASYRQDRYPRWSPTGDQIAFVSENPVDGGWDIYLMNADGSSINRLTDSTNAPNVSGLIFGTLTWSPDGSRIVFSACVSTVSLDDCELYTIGIDGMGFTQLTDSDEVGAFNPDWKSVGIEDGVSENDS